METLMILSAGIIATGFMTGFMNVCAICLRRNLYTLKILTQMLATLSIKAPWGNVSLFRFVAIAVHYGIGILFALAYYWLRAFGGRIQYGRPVEPLITGIIYGTIGVLGWAIFIRIHPAPVRSVPWPLYLCCIFIGHIVFAFAMVFSFGFWKSVAVY